ncbi:MAG: 4-alpha-glucanotransferase [Propionibacteriaceae bacterium]|jgi:4-alpha-glucanotransferase|nr:4-alpha-glucanotransferase [Propionibacteriaceae bacterium]
MTEIDSALRQLAAAYQIETEYWDWKGHRSDASAETVIAALAGLGVDASTSAAIRASLADHELLAWRRPLPPVVVVEQGRAAQIQAHVTSGEPALVTVICENGQRLEVPQVANDVPDREVDGRWVGRASFALPTDIELGYHRLVLHSGSKMSETQLIVTPAAIGWPPLLERERVWGFMLQLYSVADRSGWCFGDLLDLSDIAIWAKSVHGADFILTNPLHAAEPVAPMEPSPYLPSSRRFVNPVYIRPEAIQEFTRLSDRRRRRIAELRRNLQHSLATDNSVRRDDVWAAKKLALEQIFQAARRPARELALEAFVAHEGRPLWLWAVYCTLSEQLGSDWRRWDSDFQDPTSPAVADFAHHHAEQVRFHMWLQWVAEAQLTAAQQQAELIGMKVGIMADLAVGVSPAGAATWMWEGLFSQGVTVGAPPDSYNQSGQDWAQPPWRPDKLEEMAYAPFRSMVQAIVRHSGAIRVDHILGLFRLWWVPAGHDPTAGVYVRYNHEALIGILALEAQRAGTIVVGEDLGTVEPWVRDYLAQRGILGTSILWFEYSDDGQVKPPTHWRELTMGSVTTHDLPPTTGYLAHDHVALRHSLGLLTESLADEIAKDVAEQGAIIHELEERGLLMAGERDPHAILLGLHRFLAQTQARMHCVALVDAVGERRIQNQPGTADEYPNWRVPLADSNGHRLTLEEIYDLPQVAELSRIMNQVDA